MQPNFIFNPNANPWNARDSTLIQASPPPPPGLTVNNTPGHGHNPPIPRNPYSTSMVVRTSPSKYSQPISRAKPQEQRDRLKSLFMSLRKKDTTECLNEFQIIENQAFGTQVGTQVLKIYTVSQLFIHALSEGLSESFCSVEAVFDNLKDANDMVHEFWTERLRNAPSMQELVENPKMNFPCDGNGCLSARWKFTDKAVLEIKVQMGKFKSSIGGDIFTPPLSATLPIQEGTEPTGPDGAPMFPPIGSELKDRK